MQPAMSNNMKEYFERISSNVNMLYDIASRARKKGLDPTTEIECPLANDIAGRVENLVGPKGVGKRIRELKKQGYDYDQVTFKIADEIIENKLGNYNTEEEKADRAIRVALAIETMGVVSAPLEGISSIKIRKNLHGGSPYLSIYFAGPIRAAGGTIQALAVLIADYVRSKMNISPYIPTEEEIGRMVEEVKLYDMIKNLQYPSTKKELEFALQNLKIELNGVPTENREVSRYRNLKRIETNVVRSGPCLVLNDGVLLKSKKILKIIKKMKIPGWEWLNKIKQYSHSEDEVANTNKKANFNLNSSGPENEAISDESPVDLFRKKSFEKIPPIEKYIAEVIAGRPVFSYPSRKGGHRLRYGRSRNTGLAACGINPNTMYILNEFLAVGTQIKIERPGKAASVTPVSSIEGPVCLLQNGDVVQFSKINVLKKTIANNPIERILWIGDILFGFGEFAENNHILVPSGYVEEWWILELEQAFNQRGNLTVYSDKMIQSWIDNPFHIFPSGSQALEISKVYNIPIHPHYTFHYGNVNGNELLHFRSEIISYYKKSNLNIIDIIKLRIPNTTRCKEFLMNIFCPHKNMNDFIELDEDLTPIFIEIFALNKEFLPHQYEEIVNQSKKVIGLHLFAKITDFKIKNKCPYYMGSRMGRPEKAKERKMRPPVHTLFPLGHSNNNRIIQKAIKNSGEEAEIVLRQCPTCNDFTHLNFCDKCKQHTIIKKYCDNCKSAHDVGLNECPLCNLKLRSFSKRKISITNQFNNFLNKIGKRNIPNIKGVKGLMSEFKMSEPLGKGILRAIHNVWVFKDGTIRFDAIDIPFTHFTPKEIHVSINKLHELGYNIDYKGNPLIEEDQICELKCQDFIATEYCGDYFVRVSKFIDDELEFLYDQPRYYNCEGRQDLIGHYFAGLAPHTSAAIVGRLIGFSPINAGYGHPCWHAAKRRNCDGDEDGLMLLLDCLINFSRYYLPSKIGGKMDAPLVLTVLLDPNEIDTEAHNLDTLSRYSLEFYEETQKYATPGEVIENLKMGLLKSKLHSSEQYEGIGFTHPTRNINSGPKLSIYKRLETMVEKIDSQMDIVGRIDAVEADGIANKILQSHFLRDISGNMRKFSQQGFRCTKCQTKYRRIPLSGKCNSCGGPVILTVTRGGIVKYLKISLEISNKYNLGNYTTQRIELIEEYVKSLTDNPKIKQVKITSFFK